MSSLDRRLNSTPRLPRRSGAVPFSLNALPLAPVRAAIDAIEDEMLAVARADAAGTRAVVAENAARAAAGEPRLTVRAARALCGRFGGDWSGLRFLRLVKRLVRVDGAYWRIRDWNRGVARKQALLAAARENARVREKLLAALGGEAACERWERRAAGLGWRPSPGGSPDLSSGSSQGSSRGRSRDGDDVDAGSQTTKAPARGRGRDGFTNGVKVRLPSLPRKTGRRRRHGGRPSLTPVGGRAPRSFADAPIPVWPCEVLTNAAYDAMAARVREVVVIKEREAASGRRSAAHKTDRMSRATHTPRYVHPPRGVCANASGAKPGLDREAVLAPP